MENDRRDPLIIIIFFFLFFLSLGADTIGGLIRRPYGVVHVQEKRERERALGLEHVMEDGGCPVGPTRIGSGGGIWVPTQIWGLE